MCTFIYFHCNAFWIPLRVDFTMLLHGGIRAAPVTFNHYSASMCGRRRNSHRWARRMCREFFLFIENATPCSRNSFVTMRTLFRNCHSKNEKTCTTQSMFWPNELLYRLNRSTALHVCSLCTPNGKICIGRNRNDVTYDQIGQCWPDYSYFSNRIE